jgi:Flp pilus assembly protein TadG
MTKLITYITDFYASYKLRLIAAVLVTISLIGAYHAGKAVGAAEEQGSLATAQVAATKKGVQDGANIDQGVIALPDADLDRRYNKWLRD